MRDFEEEQAARDLARREAAAYVEEFCPKCNASFQGTQIPDKDAHMFAGEYDKDGRKWFSRKTGIYCTDADRTVAWRCPDCKEEWGR